MARCPKLFPAVMLLSLLGMPAVVEAAGEPVASAVIPPPLADPPAVAAPAATPAAPRPKRAPAATAASKPAGAPKPAGATASAAKPAGAEAWKRVVRSAASMTVEPAKRAAAQKSSRHAKRERHLQFARMYPPPHIPSRPRYYYPGAPVIDPGSDGPPPWYDRAGPPGYPYPGPRGPW